VSNFYTVTTSAHGEPLTKKELDMTNLNIDTIGMISIDTSMNDRTGALKRLARALDEQFLVDQLSILEGRHASLGYLSDELRQERDTYASWLMGKAQEVYDNFAQIQAAF
jgi:hypothetical protein